MNEHKKTCLRCGRNKIRKAFASDASKRDGLSPYCRDCVTERYYLAKLRRKQLSPLDQLLRTPLLPP